MKNQKGFSLVELLVVVIIIAIIAAIAIPNLLASRRAANEASAVSSLRTIHSAEATYQATQGNNVNYGLLSELNTAGLIDSVLSAGTKSGYGFVEAQPTASDSYCVVATPSSGTTGIRIFAVASDGVIYTSDSAGGGAPSCTGTAPFAVTGGNPLQ